MSDYGFEALNNNGKVLVSDKTRNLHFYQKASLISSYNDDINDLGAPTTITSIKFLYRTTCTSIPFPFFTLSGSSTSTGLTRVYGTPGNWYIELLVGSYYGNALSKYITAPTVYVFADLTNRPKIITNNNYGMIVYGPQGPDDVACFDSRYIPLVITGGYGATPPSTPFYNSINAEPGVGYYDGRGLGISAYHSGLSYNSKTIIDDFSVKTDSFIYNINNSNISKPIFCYSAVGQCEREYTFTDRVLWDERNYLGIGSAGQFDASCRYWYMYRSGIRLASNNSLYCTWLPSNRGYLGGYKRSEYGSSGVETIVLAIAGAVTFGVAGLVLAGYIGSKIFTDSAGVTYSTQNGAPPFNDLTINTSETTVLISDGTLYD